MSRRRPLSIALVVTALALAGCSEAGGGEAAGPEAAGAQETSAAVAAPADAEGGSIFDSSVLHDISVTFDQDDYDAMITTFAETGEKEWIEATVTIDGETYEQVGLRLKGNSSLQGLRGGGRAGATDGATAGRGGFGGPGGSASADAPASLPWLIRLDEYVEGQSHDGYVDLVVRSNNSETSLNEAVALELLEEAGLASQQAASTSFSVNGSDPELRLVVEHPDDDEWQDLWFEGDGALYKAESTGDWSYRGDDPASYEEVFDQEGGKKVADLTPLIELLQFVDEADDATFEAELPERLDVESFATYLAMMDLIENTDDIDGPGNNAYLWWDAETEQFTIVPWDMNLAFGSMGGPGGGGAPGGGFPGGERPEGMELPEGMTPPQGMTPPEGMERPEAMTPPEGFGGGRGGFGGGSNPLVERFHDTAAFEALYQQALTDLRAELFDSGRAEEILDAWSAMLVDQASKLVSADVVESDAAAIAAALTSGD